MSLLKPFNLVDDLVSVIIDCINKSKYIIIGFGHIFVLLLTNKTNILMIGRSQ